MAFQSSIQRFSISVVGALALVFLFSSQAFAQVHCPADPTNHPADWTRWEIQGVNCCDSGFQLTESCCLKMKTEEIMARWGLPRHDVENLGGSCDVTNPYIYPPQRPKAGCRPETAKIHCYDTPPNNHKDRSKHGLTVKINCTKEHGQNCRSIRPGYINRHDLVEFSGFRYQCRDGRWRVNHLEPNSCKLSPTIKSCVEGDGVNTPACLINFTKGTYSKNTRRCCEIHTCEQFGSCPVTPTSTTSTSTTSTTTVPKKGGGSCRIEKSSSDPKFKGKPRTYFGHHNGTKEETNCFVKYGIPLSDPHKNFRGCNCQQAEERHPGEFNNY